MNEEEAIKASLRRVAEKLKAEESTVVVGLVSFPGALSRFHYQATLTFHPGTQRELMVLIISVGCSSAETVRLEARLAHPDRMGDQALTCLIERGDGDEIAELPPVLLEEAPGSPEFARKVRDFAKRCDQFFDDNFDAMVSILREPR